MKYDDQDHLRSEKVMPVPDPVLIEFLSIIAVSIFNTIQGFKVNASCMYNDFLQAQVNILAKFGQMREITVTMESGE